MTVLLERLLKGRIFDQNELLLIERIGATAVRPIYRSYGARRVECVRKVRVSVLGAFLHLFRFRVDADDCKTLDETNDDLA